MRCALFLPIFGELSEPRRVAELAAEAEAAGFDGMFVWDHVLYHDPVVDIGDPWVTLAAIACATERIRLGPMVTPVPRRRPQRLARETVAVDRLSGGRLVFGAGLGGDPGRELSALGEETDPVARAHLLDEGLSLLEAMWSGDRVDHPGPRFRAEGVRFRPTPLQRPRIPVWLGARYPHRRPVRRAARYDGVFPIGLDGPEALRELVEVVRTCRPAELVDRPFDVAVQGIAGQSPAGWAEAGATWWLVRFEPYTVTAAEVRDAIAAGPPGRAR
ncbi:MAG: LLM class flavin-dependent oxidoreductase [Acidimicrobiia bacterium]